MTKKICPTKFTTVLKKHHANHIEKNLSNMEEVTELFQ